MNNTKSDLVIALKELLNEGIQILANETDTEVKVGGVKIKKQKNFPSLLYSYNSWYSKALPLINILLPDRLEDFISDYKNIEIRNEITKSTYTISDYLSELVVKNEIGTKLFEPKDKFASRLSNQISILKLVKESINYILNNIEGLIQADLFDSEIEAAKELKIKKHLRAAGAIAGVVLERHLFSVITNHALIIKNKPTLNDMNECLKGATVYDIPTWRKIQALADIRNLCAHGATREPTDSEIDDLLDGVDKIIKTIF